MMLRPCQSAPSHLRALATLARCPPIVFDTLAKAAQKARAAAAPDAASFDYLRDEVAGRVVDRLCDMSRNFPRALDLYCGSGHVLRALREVENKPGIKTLALADIDLSLVTNAGWRTVEDVRKMGIDTSTQYVFREEELDQVPPFLEPASLDLVISSSALHWVNDLPGVLSRVNALLKPDGLFIGAMMGGETLRELRIAMQLAEEEARGGVSPHVSPMVQLRDAGGVLGRAGLKLTTVDVDEIKIPFRDMHAVMRHVKGMGEGNAVAARRPYYGRKVFVRAEEIYQEMFGYVDEQGRPCVPATFQIVHLIGWSPAGASVQPQPAARGSAGASLADLSNIVANDGPAPSTKIESCSLSHSL
jgi:NADH dehydrogenase [ubiquinone] 1 alpha subcomplex assembly factor 5